MSEKDKIDVNEEEEEEVITLATPDGEEVDFTEIAAVEFEDKLYVIMQPVELFEGMEDDEALVFAVTDENEEDARFDVVSDDRIIDGVFAEYYKLLDEQAKRPNFPNKNTETKTMITPLRARRGGAYFINRPKNVAL